MSINQRLNFEYCHFYELMKRESMYFSNGNRYIGGISHRLSVTLQARLFTNNNKEVVFSK